MSVIDIPKVYLDSEIFDCKTTPDCKVREDVRNKILDTLRMWFVTRLGNPRMEEYITGVYIVGSSVTYQWRYDSDIDVTVVLKPDLVDSPIYYRLVENVNDELNGSLMIGDHPVNYYFKFGLAPSNYDGIYDLWHNTWVRKPEEVAIFDPRRKFLQVWEEFQSWAENIDDELGDLRRNLIDYQQISRMINKVPDDYLPYLYKQLSDRLYEINKTINDLIDEYKELHKERKEAYERLMSQPIENVLSASWLPEGIKYKFAERYKYTELLTALKRMMMARNMIKSENDIAELIKNLNEFYTLPEKTSALLFAAFTRSRDKYKYPYKTMRRVLKHQYQRRPIRLTKPPQFLITEEDIADEISTTIEEGFNTMSETKPLPKNTTNATPTWEEVDNLLLVPASLTKTAEDDETPTDNPPVGDDFPSPDRENDPAVKELQKMLTPSEDAMNEATKGKGVPKSDPSAFFKSKKPDVPETVKQLSDFDRSLYLMLEQKRTEAINNMDVASLRVIDAKIEELLNKYWSPLPDPKPLTDSSRLAASNINPLIDELHARLIAIGLPPERLYPTYKYNQTQEFIAHIPINLKLNSYPHGTIETVAHKPVIIRVDTETNTVLPYLWTLDGKQYDMTKQGARELIKALINEDNVDFVIGM